MRAAGDPGPSVPLCGCGQRATIDMGYPPAGAKRDPGLRRPALPQRCNDQEPCVPLAMRVVAALGSPPIAVGVDAPLGPLTVMPGISTAWWHAR